jgi:hypothetical protein
MFAVIFTGETMHSKKQCYLIRIEGHIGLDWSSLFDEIKVRHTEDGQTVLCGALPDQTALHGVLIRIRDLGLTLVEIKRIVDPFESNYFKGE